MLCLFHFFSSFLILHSLFLILLFPLCLFLNLKHRIRNKESESLGFALPVSFLFFLSHFTFLILLFPLCSFLNLKHRIRNKESVNLPFLICYSLFLILLFPQNLKHRIRNKESESLGFALPVSFLFFLSHFTFLILLFPLCSFLNLKHRIRNKESVRIYLGHLDPVNGETGIRANNTTIGASDTCIRIFHKGIVITAAVYFPVQCQNFIFACLHTNSTSFASFFIYHNCSFYFCHNCKFSHKINILFFLKNP